MEPDGWPLPNHAFHLADAENWRSIERNGLLSAAELIKQAGLDGPDAQSFNAYRSRTMRLPSGALIRDQRPMPPSALARCLDAGMSPADWYRLVNSKVFFWLHVDRLTRHLAACAERPQIVVAIDLRELVRRHGRRAFLTPFNVGNAKRRPAPRGHRTFVPLLAWLDTRWDMEAAPNRPPRPRSHPPAEIAVEGGIPDLMDFVVEVSPIDAGQPYRAKPLRPRESGDCR